jgi:hypothetical protein
MNWMYLHLKRILLWQVWTKSPTLREKMNIERYKSEIARHINLILLRFWTVKFLLCDCILCNVTIYRPNNNNLVKMQQLLELLVVLLVFLVYGCLISRLYLGTFLWFSGDYLVGPYFKLWLIKKKSQIVLKMILSVIDLIFPFFCFS